MNSPITYRQIKSKEIIVKEIMGADRLILEKGQKIIDHRVIHQVVPEASASSTVAVWPGYKTVIVLECVKYQDE